MYVITDKQDRVVRVLAKKKKKKDRVVRVLGKKKKKKDRVVREMYLSILMSHNVMSHRI